MPTSQRPTTSLGLRRAEKTMEYSAQRPASVQGMRPASGQTTRPQSRHSVARTDPGQRMRPKTAFTVSSTMSERKPACRYTNRPASSTGSSWASTSSSFSSKTNRSSRTSSSKIPSAIDPPTLLEHNRSKRPKRKPKAREEMKLNFHTDNNQSLRSKTSKWQSDYTTEVTIEPSKFRCGLFRRKHTVPCCSQHTLTVNAASIECIMCAATTSALVASLNCRFTSPKIPFVSSVNMTYFVVLPPPFLGVLLLVAAYKWTSSLVNTNHLPRV